MNRPIHRRRPLAALWPSYGLALTVVAVGVLVAHLAAKVLPHANLSLVFLTGVLFVAARTGLGPALFAAVLSFLAFNYFFIDPQLTFAVKDDGDVATLMFFLLMAGVTGHLAARMRAEMDSNQASLVRLSSLNEFGRQMLSAGEQGQLLDALAAQIRGACACPVAVYTADVQGTLRGESARGPVKEPDAETLVRAWASESTDPLTLGRWTFYRLASPRGPLGLVALECSVPGKANVGLVSGLCDQAALAMERIRLSADLTEAKVVSETEQLRSALLSSVSHDLRTPLASILGAASSLQAYGESFSVEDRLELLTTVLTEARRLDRYIQNLLDMTRLGRGDLSLRRDWVDVGDLIASAVARLRTPGELPSPVDVDVRPETPLLWVHGALVEQALVNLLDNAARFSPPHGRIRVEAGREAEGLAIRVCDQGPGVPPSERERIFDMFYTLPDGDRSGRQGTGLGLAICRGMIGAHGGSVCADDGREGIGTCMTIRLPLMTPRQGGDT